MSEARLRSHLARHPLTHDQALRLRVLLTFRDRQLSYQPADHRLLALGLAQREQREIVRLTERALRVALGPGGYFCLPERHPFFRDCPECRGSGVRNEAELFLGRRSRRAICCSRCRGKGFMQGFDSKQ